MSKTYDVEATIKEIKEKVSKGNGGNSVSDAVSLGTAFYNSPDYALDDYSAFHNDGSVGKTQHVAELRDELSKTVGKTLSLDPADVEQVRQMEFPERLVRPMIKAADDLTTLYLTTGRSKTMPNIAKDQSRWGISMAVVPEKSADTTKPIEETPGVWKAVPTGNNVTTQAYKAIKAKNTPGSHLKTVRPSKG